MESERYEHVLMHCVRMGADRSCIVSGYALLEMCTRLVNSWSVPGDSGARIGGANGTLLVRYSRAGLAGHLTRIGSRSVAPQVPDAVSGILVMKWRSLPNLSIMGPRP